MTRSPDRWYRPDITGLRTLAIVPVVAFHAGATVIPGGFIGVDIFYVISGFLITTLLVREVGERGRIALGTFWAKRVRRLVPALVVVVVGTLPIAAVLSSVISWDVLAAQAVASVLYVANILFWQQSTNYFDTGTGLSPYLHMWSLGVEEQFYLVWPLMVILGAVIARRWLKLKTVLAIGFTLVFVSSLGLSIWLSPRDPDAAFYLLPTRAWEFAGAGLLALTAARIRPAAGLRLLMSSAGVVIIGLGLLTIHEGQPYPGIAALIPFVGTMLILAAGGAPRPDPVTRALQARPLVWIGEVSYSWYLWHWPLIVFAAALFPGQIWATAAAGVLSLGVGALSYYLVERPLRFAPRLTGSVRRTFKFGAAMTAAASVAAVAVFGAAWVLMRQEPLRTYAAAAETLPTTNCSDSTEPCVMGDRDGQATVALIGDSHAGHWVAAFDEAARDAGIRLIVRWKSSCPSMQVTVIDNAGRYDPTCASFREDTSLILANELPQAVVISNAFGYNDTIRADDLTELARPDQIRRWKDAYREQLSSFQDAGIKVGVVEDNPRMLFNPAECLTRLGADAVSCQSSVDDAFSLITDLASVHDEMTSEFAIEDVFDVNDDICSKVCMAVDSAGLPIFQDQTHLSDVWTRSKSPEAASFLRAVAE
ncbi:peptidoglycan/LPS O-acetylase OafA/YrhL [Microbacterium sp. SLBN-154]|uniref:acyltransferase family protein n=1 Tax=Microbacterium sp. SLBN-154 TaxID=2768458 RepID=UPI00116CA313|nr:acyltransferase family protein [Microbacterium sp. SLBN-154]TQK18625.1 peptidoglycan/LPS O-acetylase OafA/YrhL [Microbacterium sp. SLBN-154]